MSSCILWEGKVSLNGYGRCSNGKDYAHREAYISANGAIPKGLVVKHACDTKLCVNPDHLSAGTQAENVQEAYDRGLRSPARKLSTEQFKDVLERCNTENNSALAREYGVSRQLICCIKKGRIVWGIK